MNDDLFYTDNSDDTTSKYNTETTETTETPVSSPYRYKYENGEKKETTDGRENFYNYYSGYDTYQNNTSKVSVEVPAKKKFFPKAIKWLAGAACFGVIAGAAFIGTSYLASEVFDIKLLSAPSTEDVTGEGDQTLFPLR